MKKAYKYKINPTYKQQQQLLQTFGCARFIYNWGLDKKIKAWTSEHKTISYFEFAKELTVLKKIKGYEWLKNVPNECLQQSLRNLDNAYTQFFKAKKGFPKFKSKRKSKDCSKYLNAVKFDFDNWKVRVPKCGWVKLCYNKSFDLSSCKIGTLTVSRDKCGEFWCSILVEDNKPQKSKAKIFKGTSVGIDLGIKDYAILSDGTKYSNPKYYERNILKLKVLQHKFARTVKGSNHHEVMRLKVARQYRKITNMHMDFLHKLTTDLVRHYDTICLESLNVEGMLKNHHLALAIQSASWSEFVRQLKYKAEWEGKNIIFIGRFEPSSKTCSKCGYINRELTLNDRKWICPICGERHDRDVNAAINIKNFALNPQALISIEEKVENIIDRR
jgi:putative transposase